MATAVTFQRTTTPSISQVSLQWLIRVCLTASFTAAFSQYLMSSQIAQVAHVVLFLVCGLMVLAGRQRNARLQNILGDATLLVTSMLFTEAISYISGDNYRVEYGILFLLVVFSARLIVQEIGMPSIVRSYSQAALLTVSMLAIVGRSGLRSGRFTGGTRAHPNLIAFVLGGYVPVLLWRAIEERRAKRRYAWMALTGVALVLIFLSGSRGTLSGLLAAFLVGSLRAVFTPSYLQRLRLSPRLIILSILSVLFLGYFLGSHHRLAHIAGFVVESLQLNSSQRGLHSGLSGRTRIWDVTFAILRHSNRWFLGFGYRAGDRLVGTIDNGYIQLLFESGLIAGSVVLGYMSRTLYFLWQASRLRENNAWTRYYIMLFSLMVVYLLNNISTRYLFTYGSSFSLLVLCAMLCSKKELLSLQIRGRSGSELRRVPGPQNRPSPPWRPGGR